MNNQPNVKLGLVVGSTDWLPSELAMIKGNLLVEEYKNRYPDDGIYFSKICLTDNDMSIKRIKKDLSSAGCNALCTYFANYGPESTIAAFIGGFDGPVMLCGAAEDADGLQDKRKDSLSGIINANYSLSIHSIKAYIPNRSVGTVNECVESIHEFVSIARAYLAVKNLKIISFGPRPSGYYAAYAPNHQLRQLGVSVVENSELELLNSFDKHQEDKRIQNIVSEIKNELDNNIPEETLNRIAQYELTLTDWIRTRKGNSDYVAMTSPCWPTFPVNFGFVPCYVNSRLTGRGIPISCEVDVYGAISEYVGQVISDNQVTILNINNNIPADVFNSKIKDKVFNEKKYKITDLFLGYHCGVTCSQKMKSSELKKHYVNDMLLEGKYSDGTIQGQIESGKITLFRIQGTAEGGMRAYVAQGQILPIDLDTYGGYGVIAIPELSRFIDNVIMCKHYPNHTTVIFEHCASKLISFLRMMGIDDIDYNHDSVCTYSTENYFDLNKEWF